MLTELHLTEKVAKKLVEKFPEDAHLKPQVAELGLGLGLGFISSRRSPSRQAEHTATGRCHRRHRHHCLT